MSFIGRVECEFIPGQLDREMLVAGSSRARGASKKLPRPLKDPERCILGQPTHKNLGGYDFFLRAGDPSKKRPGS